MILGLFSSTEKVKIQYSVPSKVGGGGSGLVYIVYLMSGGTSLATEVGGHNFNSAAFGLLRWTEFFGLATGPEN